MFGKELDKSEQMSNWNRRPLRPAQLLYSALDAYCLVDIYELLKLINQDIFCFDSVEQMLYVVKQTYSENNVQCNEPSTSNGGNGNKKRNKRKNKPNDHETISNYNLFE